MTARVPEAGAAATLIAVSLPGTARAHLVTTDLGPFYDGALHPLLTPEDFLGVLGLSLLAGFAGPGGARRAFVGLCVGWLAGTTTAYTIGPHVDPARLLTGVALLGVGALGLLARRLPAPVLGLGATLFGTWRGSINGTVLRTDDGSWLTVLGTMVGLFALTAMAAATSVRLARRNWYTVLRVAASWIAAIGLLMIGWQLRG